jgi:hypothetical protein
VNDAFERRFSSRLNRRLLQLLALSVGSQGKALESRESVSKYDATATACMYACTRFVQHRKNKKKNLKHLDAKKLQRRTKFQFKFNLCVRQPKKFDEGGACGGG